jgi:hypothetical protein
MTKCCKFTGEAVNDRAAAAGAVAGVTGGAVLAEMVRAAIGVAGAARRARLDAEPDALAGAVGTAVTEGATCASRAAIGAERGAAVAACGRFFDTRTGVRGVPPAAATVRCAMLVVVRAAAVTEGDTGAAAAAEGSRLGVLEPEPGGRCCGKGCCGWRFLALLIGALRSSCKQPATWKTNHMSTRNRQWQTLLH